MTRDQAEKSVLIMDAIKSHEEADRLLRGFHERALLGDEDALNNLAKLSIAINDNSLRKRKKQLEKL